MSKLKLILIFLLKNNSKICMYIIEITYHHSIILIDQANKIIYNNYLPSEKINASNYRHEIWLKYKNKIEITITNYINKLIKIFFFTLYSLQQGKVSANRGKYK